MENNFYWIRRLTENTNNIFRWFDAERKVANAALSKVIEHTYYEKAIRKMIDDVL